MRTLLAVVLVLILAGCGPNSPTPGPPTPVPISSREPMGVVGYGTNGDMVCEDQWVQGLLRSDIEVEDRILGMPNGNPLTLEVWPLDTVAWPSAAPTRFVPVRWPLEYSALRLADGSIAVLDGAGRVVATTGGTYRLKGAWALVGAIGGPHFGEPPWIDAFNVCRGRDTVIPT